MKKYSSKQKESIIIVEKKMKTTSQIGNILQFFSPFLATKFCARIFASPFKFKTPEREMMYRKSAKNELISIPSIKKEVMIYTYGYSTKKILIAHGWSGRGTQLYELADKLLENKMMVISFDGPAHGLSTGKTTNMLEFLDTIKEIDKKYGPFEAAIGHSFGAMSLLNAISRNKLNLRKLVVISADDSIFEALKKFISKLGLKSKIALKLKTEYEKRKEQIKNGYIYPYYTLQAYFDNRIDLNLLSICIIKTTDLYDEIENNINVKTRTSDNIFKYILWSDIDKNKIKKILI